MLAESYNNKNTDSIKYYSEDAVSFSNGKMPLEGKKAIHESMKSELLTFRKDQNRIRNAKKYMLQTMEIW
jgi:ketosteroid isomerase-like protein